jgi:hypothetical protein
MGKERNGIGLVSVSVYSLELALAFPVMSGYILSRFIMTSTRRKNSCEKNISCCRISEKRDNNNDRISIRKYW